MRHAYLIAGIVIGACLALMWTRKPKAQPAPTDFEKRMNARNKDLRKKIDQYQDERREQRLS